MIHQVTNMSMSNTIVYLLSLIVKVEGYINVLNF